MGDIFIEIDGKAVPVAVVWVHLQGTNSNGSDCTIVVPAAFLKDVFDPTGGGWYDLGSVTLGTGVSPSSLVLSYTTISTGNHAPDLICVGYAAQAVYDAAQETTETIDADGRASVILYNGIGQETGENWYTTTTTTGTAAESLGWTYNVAGLMQTASDQNIAAGTSVAEDYFSYDAEGRETSESQEVPGLTTLVAVTDQYTAGNRTELSAERRRHARFRQQLRLHVQRQRQPLRPDEPGHAVRAVRRQRRGRQDGHVQLPRRRPVQQHRALCQSRYEQRSGRHQTLRLQRGRADHQPDAHRGRPGDLRRLHLDLQCLGRGGQLQQRRHHRRLLRGGHRLACL